MNDKLLVGPATVLTNSPEQPVCQRAGVLCEGDRIVAVSDFDELARAHGDARRLDADDKLVMPALINAHHHLYSTFARGMPIPAGTALHDFPHILEGIWWRLDRALDLDAVQAGAYPPAIDCLRWGCGTLVDHHASPDAIKGSLDALAHVCDELGLRAALCYEITDRNGPEGAKAGIEENLAFARAHSTHRRARGLLGLHASFTVSDATLEALASASTDGVPIHVHVAEDVADLQRSKQQFGAGPIERLERFGLLRKGSIIVHGIHLDESELERVRNAGAWLVHNPESNANNAVGALDVIRALEMGVRVALGTDGMASNMLRAAKSAYLMARHVRRDPTQGMDLPRRLLENNALLARELFGEPLLGALVAGAPADLCVVDYEPPTPLLASTLDAHLVFGITEAPVVSTVTAGRIRMHQGRVANMDREKLRERIAKAAEHVWERLG